MKKQLTANQQIIENDIMRFKSNSKASLFTYLALVFGCLYFLCLYGQQAGDIAGTFENKTLGSVNVYTCIFGLSVILNLVILLGGFLASQEIKNYSKTYCYVAFVFAIIQVVRIFVYPMNVSSSELSTGGTIFPTYSYIFMLVWLVLSAVCFALSGLLGITGASKRAKFLKQLDAGEVDLEAAYKEEDVAGEVA